MEQIHRIIGRSKNRGVLSVLCDNIDNWWKTHWEWREVSAMLRLLQKSVSFDGHILGFSPWGLEILPKKQDMLHVPNDLSEFRNN